MRRSMTILTAIILISMWLVAVPVQAASAFTAVAFKTQWQQGEALLPNYWGPLSTAHDGVQEPYKESAGRQRTVQYFDKTRMELGADGAVTNGLLTVELKTGNMQLGDATFEKRAPANIHVAGDGSDGPIYADLSKLPQKQAGDAVGVPYVFANGSFSPVSSANPAPFDLVKISDPKYWPHVADPGGQYGTAVFLPFANAVLVGGFVSLFGYPITPMFFAQVHVGGTATWVLVQAFERRVLTYNPKNPPDFRVEFGNIGQHYYQWRYPNGPPAASVIQAPPTVPSGTSPDFRPFAERWGSHGFGLTINGQGKGVALLRSYRSCNDNPSPPCDPFFNAMASLTFTRIDGVVAYGTVTESEPSSGFATGEDVSLTLLPYGMAVLLHHGTGRHPLCGPRYRELAPPEIKNSRPCGA